MMAAGIDASVYRLVLSRNKDFYGNSLKSLNVWISMRSVSFS